MIILKPQPLTLEEQTAQLDELEQRAKREPDAMVSFHDIPQFCRLEFLRLCPGVYYMTPGLFLRYAPALRAAMTR